MKTDLYEPEVMVNDTIETIYKRRAIRKYKDRPVDLSLIKKIIDCGRMAPSAMNKQPWRFYILTQKESIHEFSKQITRMAVKEFIKSGPRKLLKTVAGLLHFPIGGDLLKRKDPVFYEAPVVIFITAARDNEWAALDVGMCAQNMLLAAKSLGLDSCPVGFAKYAEHTKKFTSLRVPSTEQVHLAVIIGYGDETPEVHKRLQNNAFFMEEGGRE